MKNYPFDPPSLTPKAAKIVAGMIVNNVADEDWDSYADYMIWQDERDAYVSKLLKDQDRDE